MQKEAAFIWDLKSQTGGEGSAADKNDACAK
jgi:hypothetical protein